MTKEAKVLTIFKKLEDAVDLWKVHYHDLYVFLDFSKEDGVYKRVKRHIWRLIWTRGIRRK